MKKFVAVLLIILSLATPALANTTTNIVGGLVALNMLFGSRNSVSVGQRAEKNKLSAYAKQSAEALCNMYAILAVNEGEKKAIDDIVQKFRAENYRVEVEEIDLGTTTITIADKDNAFISEIDVSQNENKVVTTSRFPVSAISEKFTLSFANKEDIKKKVYYSMLDSVGFEISEKIKSDTESWIIVKVKPESYAAKAGMLEGSEIFAIDAMQAKDTAPYKVALYVQNCAACKIPFNVTFVDSNGKTQSATITPK